MMAVETAVIRLLLQLAIDCSLFLIISTPQLSSWPEYRQFFWLHFNVSYGFNISSYISVILIHMKGSNSPDFDSITLNQRFFY